MRDRRRVLLRPGAVALLVATTLVTACLSSPSPTSSPSPAARPTPAPSPSPTPLPTPRFTNEPDPSLSALIPTSAAQWTVVQPPITDYAITPGDIGLAAYGELGARFQTLVIAFVREPRLSLYAMRVDPPAVTTEELEPHLATAGRYVGIAGLDRDPWALAEVAGHWVWVRPSDSATLPGTKVYTWAADEFVFLLIGVSDEVNEAVISLLPGEPPPTPSPAPSVGPTAAPTPGGS
ncbi:MAG: hypothetical protein ACRDFZ_03040 [Candidatus Limnocylindria bacterium]